MRVIAGTARSLRLVTPEGTDTRPTTDRIRETLFNMLQGEIAGRVVLDLFAGSGALGIESLSRGSKRAWFVESNPAAFQCIKENVNFTGMEERAVLIKRDVMMGLDMIHEETVDLIFIDPPYQKGYERKVLELLAEQSYVGVDTRIILEASVKWDVSDLPSAFMIVKVKKYKTNQHLFIVRKEGNK